MLWESAKCPIDIASRPHRMPESLGRTFESTQVKIEVSSDIFIVSSCSRRKAFTPPSPYTRGIMTLDIPCHVFWSCCFAIRSLGHSLRNTGKFQCPSILKIQLGNSCNGREDINQILLFSKFKPVIREETYLVGSQEFLKRAAASKPSTRSKLRLAFSDVVVGWDVTEISITDFGALIPGEHGVDCLG